MRTQFRSLAFSVVVLALFVPRAVAEHVSRPGAPIVDLGARRRELQWTTSRRIISAIGQLRSCMAMIPVNPPKGKMAIPPFYLRGAHGDIDPASIRASAQYDQFEKRVAEGMNEFLVTGSISEANCAQRQIDSWAQSGELLNYDPRTSSQSWYQVSLTLSSTAIAESVLIQCHALDAKMVHRDLAWMSKVAHQMISFEKVIPQSNNLHYWRGLAAVGVGELTADDSLFSWGIGVFRAAVNEINSAGAFPQEMAREELATTYQAFATQPLIMIAEFAMTQGIDLYAYRSPSGKTIKDAVIFVANAVKNPVVIKPFQKAVQTKNLHSPDASFQLAQIDFYLHRFGNNAPKAVWQLVPWPCFAAHVGGSATLMAAPPGN